MTIFYIFVRVSTLHSRGQCSSSLGHLSKARAPGCRLRQAESVFREVFVCSLYYSISKQILIGVLHVSVFYGSSPRLLVTNI